MYAFDDEGGYEADCDFIAEMIDETDEEILDKFFAKYGKLFDSLEPDGQIALLGEYRKAFNKIEDRKNRLMSMNGKYIITCKGIKSGKTVYLQDRKVSKGGWWTQFKSNALIFDTKQGAEKIAKTFIYNKPKVVLCK